MIEVALGIMIGMTIVGIPSMIIVYKKARTNKALTRIINEVDNKVGQLLKVHEENRSSYKKLAQEVETITNRSPN